MLLPKSSLNEHIVMSVMTQTREDFACSAVDILGSVSLAYKGPQTCLPLGQKASYSTKGINPALVRIGPESQLSKYWLSNLDGMILF